MTAAIQERMKSEGFVKRVMLPLAAAMHAFKNCAACWDFATSKVVPGQAGRTMMRIGVFAESVDNSAGVTSTPIDVRLDREIQGIWFANDTGTPVTAADVFTTAWQKDDQTVTKTQGNLSPSGRVLKVDATLGVLVAADFMTLGQATAPIIQTGTITLVSGTKTLAAGITITAASKVYVSLNTPGGGTQGVKYKVPDGSLVVGAPGTGAFAATAVDNAGATVTTDVSTLNYLIVG